ncbi:MAG: permease [Candidatus Edwardsbacteria bacterium]|nr:permease [Candidatus Edwardsbacteria bacterium]
MRKIIEKLGVGEYLLALAFGSLLLVSRLAAWDFGLGAGRNFWAFFSEMIAFLPLMFILIGLIDVWLPKEKVERHIGPGSGFTGTFWVILLAMLQAGPLYGAFPVAYLLWKKGCGVRNIFIYLGAFSTMKIPMLTFEIGFLGLKFSLLRTLFTLPVFIAIGFIMEWYLRDKQFVISAPQKEKG